MKSKIRKVFDWFVEWGKLIWELIMFIFNIPIYIRRFLEGLKIFSKSYEEIVNSLKERQRLLTADSLKGINNNEAAARIITDNINEIVRLKNEQEKMFNQLFGIFIATMALIISICALLIKINK